MDKKYTTNKFHKDNAINEAYEILNKHIPNVGAPNDTHDELIEFNIVEAMLEFARVYLNIETTIPVKRKLFMVRRPSMRGTSIPEFNYTFAVDKDDAISKVRMKWGEYDSDIIAREIKENELDNLVIGTTMYG